MSVQCKDDPITSSLAGPDDFRRTGNLPVREDFPDFPYSESRQAPQDYITRWQLQPVD